MKHTLFLASSITHSASAIAKHIRLVSRKQTAFISTAAEGEDGPKTWLSDDRTALEEAGFSLFETAGKPPSMGVSRLAPSFIARKPARDCASLQALTCLRSPSRRPRSLRFNLLTEVSRRSLFDYSITEKTPRQLRSDLGSCDIIHVNGGSTFYLLLQAQRSGFIKFIREFVADGGIYIGSSAGSIIAGPDIRLGLFAISVIFKM